MGASFDIVGEFKLSFSGKSIAIELQDRLDTIYVGLNEIDQVRSGKRKTGTAFVLIRKERGH